MTTISSRTTGPDPDGCTTDIAGRFSHRFGTGFLLMAGGAICIGAAARLLFEIYDDSVNDNEMGIWKMLRIPTMLLIPGIIGCMVHWVSLQLYLHNP